MDLNNIQKTLLTTIKEYKKVYEDSLSLAYTQMKDMPKEEKKKLELLQARIRRSTSNVNILNRLINSILKSCYNINLVYKVHYKAPCRVLSSL